MIIDHYFMEFWVFTLVIFITLLETVRFISWVYSKYKGRSTL